jgi:hypothetical protein
VYAIKFLIDEEDEKLNKKKKKINEQKLNYNI